MFFSVGGALKDVRHTLRSLVLLRRRPTAPVGLFDGVFFAFDFRDLFAAFFAMESGEGGFIPNLLFRLERVFLVTPDFAPFLLNLCFFAFHGSLVRRKERKNLFEDVETLF